ncbi:MAG TPA: maleylpyruvate isomerase family mycothiol-dependent enzyme [Micromonosporaceae bacterium]|jgi:uncharacterized protein (TIGR03083 family)|nr:maleylpyruvate isomerase family mycothiol-dependent enzyme [Micromonosporaceae bacterium]
MSRIHSMSRIHGSKEMWLAAIRSDGPALRLAAAEVNLDMSTPSRPPWTMADLLHHLGSVYRWVTDHAPRGLTTQPDRPLSAYLEEPVPADVRAWWDDVFAKTVETLDRLDADAPAWNWAPQPKKAAFWHRRLAMETAVARWDAQMTAGAAEPIEAKLASDGVAEVLDTFLPAGHRAAAARPSGLVALRATDIDHTWHVRLRGDGIALLDTDTIFDADELRARGVAAGTASDLMLVLHGRIGVDVLDITGDLTLIDAVRVG